MAFVLIFNPGSASLKFELVEVSEGQRFAHDGRKILSASLESIGNEPKLLVFEDRRIAHSQTVPAQDMDERARYALRWIDEQKPKPVGSVKNLDAIGVRVVHGADKYPAPAAVDDGVIADIERFEELAPLHNKNSVAILNTLRHELPDVPTIAVFDTSFHSTLPEVAWRYPIEREAADRHGIRKYGFHGISHRYMMERYAQLTEQQPEDVSLVTMHLESGSSACAIREGRSIDTTMGLTPLEGLMMGTRSGSIDPAIVPFLMQKEHKSGDAVMTLLNKRSGLLGIAGQTFDTRELVKRHDAAARLALEMFGYRVRLAVGAYLAAVGSAQAIVFGGGIGENTPEVRAEVCQGLENFGLSFDHAQNHRVCSGEGLVSLPESKLKAWVIGSEEGLQIAHEAVPRAAPLTGLDASQVRGAR